MTNCQSRLLLDSSTFAITHMTDHGKKYAFFLRLYDNSWSHLRDEFVEWCEVNDAICDGILVFHDEPEFDMMMKLRWG
jgi:hypothetical protein